MDGGDGNRLSRLQDQLREARHLTVRPGRRPDSFARDEEAAMDCRLPDVIARMPNLYSLSLLDFPVFKGLDAVVLLECLRVAGGVKKLRLELLMMNLAVEALGHLINAGQRCARPDRTVVGSIRSPAEVEIQPFGIEGQAYDFRPRPSDLADWWKSMINERTCYGHSIDKTVTELTQRPHYVSRRSYPQPMRDESPMEGFSHYEPPPFEAPENLQRVDGSYDMDLITKAEYRAMMAMVHWRDAKKRRAAARWLSKRALFVQTSRAGDPNSEFSGLPINLLDGGEELVNVLRWRLVDHFKCHTPEAAFFVFKDPAAAGVARDCRNGFWTQIPITHIRVRTGRGLSPEDLFHTEDRDDATQTSVPVRHLVIPPLNSDGSGGGQVTLWKTSRIHDSRPEIRYPLHTLTQRFEMVSNGGMDYQLKSDFSGKMRPLLGEDDEDWRGMEPGAEPRSMTRELRQRINTAYLADYAEQFGGKGVSVRYSMANQSGNADEAGGNDMSSPLGIWADEDDEIIGTPAGDVVEDDLIGTPPSDLDNDNALDDSDGPLAQMSQPPQSLLSTVQDLHQQVQRLMPEYQGRMAHDDQENQFLEEVQGMIQRLEHLQTSGDLTPEQLTAVQDVWNRLGEVRAFVMIRPPNHSLNLIPPAAIPLLRQAQEGLQVLAAAQEPHSAQQNGSGQLQGLEGQNEHEDEHGYPVQQLAQVPEAGERVDDPGQRRPE